MAKARQSNHRKGAGRLRKTKRCPCGKVTFPKFDLAKSVGAALPVPANRVYFCPEGGGYHFTRYDRAEYERRSLRSTVAPQEPSPQAS